MPCLRPPRPTPRRVAAAAGLFALGALPLLRTWSLQWGATDAELDATLPGDELLPVVHHTSTRGVSIRATPEQVWPWLVQLGQGRGGFYSYDVLENLVGLGIHSADRIEAHLQDLAVGDEVHLADEMALEVGVLEPGRTLVLRSPEADGPMDMPFRFTWCFTLVDAPGRTSRLIVRERYAYRSPKAALIVEPASMISFLMSQRMLRGIRERAEGFAYQAS